MTAGPVTVAPAARPFLQCTAAGAKPVAANQMSRVRTRAVAGSAWLGQLQIRELSQRGQPQGHQLHRLASVGMAIGLLMLRRGTPPPADPGFPALPGHPLRAG